MRLKTTSLWAIQGVTTVFGIAAAIWSATVLPEFISEAPVITASQRLVAGDVYSEAALADLKARADEAEGRPATPQMLAAISILRQWMLESDLRRNDASPTAGEVTKAAVIRALSVAPSDSYQWLSLYWVSRANGTFDPRYLRFLEMSYQNGPYEAWVALRRSPLVMAIFPVLTPSLQQAALEEFSGLVRSHLYGQAAAIAASVTPNTRNAIAAKIGLLSLADRESFFKAATEQGITDIIIPGVEVSPIRPWRQ